VKILVGLLVFAVLWIPSAYLALHDIGMEAHVHEFTDHVSASGGASGNGNTSYTVSGTLTDTMYSFRASCGSALFPAGGYQGGPTAKRITSYPVRGSFPDMDANQAEILAVDTALGNVPYRDEYTPGTVNLGPGFASLTDQVAGQEQALGDACNHHVFETRWQAFFACPVGWGVALFIVGWLLSLIFGGGGGGFDASITRDLFTGGWILRIWEK
jgi:hypothetical protein